MIHRHREDPNHPRQLFAAIPIRPYNVSLFSSIRGRRAKMAKHKLTHLRQAEAVRHRVSDACGAHPSARVASQPSPGGLVSLDLEMDEDEGSTMR